MSSIYREVLSKTGSALERLRGDVLRVLGLTMGKLWLTELLSEISAFRETLGFSEPVTREELVECVTGMAREGLLTVEERIKATYTGGEKDLLVGVARFAELLEALKNDEAYNRYKAIVDEVFGRG